MIALLDQDINRISDVRILDHIHQLRIEPKAVLRDWDYGAPNEKYTCWSVLEHPDSNTAIAYCENGFGPKCPWGLVSLAGGDNALSIGMDSSWFQSFLDAYFDSFAATDLHIWRVFKTGTSRERFPITAESTWEDTWERIAELRKTDPTSRYICDHGIAIRQTSGR